MLISMDIYWYIQIYTNDIPSYTSIYPLRSAYFTAGFRGPHSDAALREVVQPPLSSEQQHDERDPDPCPPEDEECFELPDADSMDILCTCAQDTEVIVPLYPYNVEEPEDSLDVPLEDCWYEC